MKKSTGNAPIFQGAVALPRSFDFWTGWFVVIASMVGSGILTNSGPILKSTQSYWALLAVWTLGGILSLIGALTLGEVASSYPQAGGDYTYVRLALGPAFGFVFGWSMVVIGFAAPIALVAYTTAKYFYPILPLALPENVFVPGAATLLIVSLTISHCLGHSSSARVQSATTFFNFVLLAGFALAGTLFGKTNWENLNLGAPLSSVSAPTWGTSLIQALYAYTGWNAATYLAGEVRNPRRNLPLTLGLGCLSVTLLYLAINLTYALALSPESLANLSADDRIVDICITNLFGAGAAKIFSLLVSLGMLAALSAFILTGPRIVYAMAGDGLFPAWAGKLHPVSKVPVTAIVVQGILALGFLWSSTFNEVLNFAGYGLAVIGIFTVAPIFWLRRREDYRPAFRMPLYPWGPVLFLLVSVASLVAGFLDAPKLSALSLGVILLGFPLYWIIQRLRVMCA